MAALDIASCGLIESASQLSERSLGLFYLAHIATTEVLWCQCDLPQLAMTVSALPRHDRQEIICLEGFYKESGHQFRLELFNFYFQPSRLDVVCQQISIQVERNLLVQALRQLAQPLLDHYGPYSVVEGKFVGQSA